MNCNNNESHDFQVEILAADSSGCSGSSGSSLLKDSSEN